MSDFQDDKRARAGLGSAAASAAADPRPALARLFSLLEQVHELEMQKTLVREWLDSQPEEVISWGLSELLRAVFRGSIQARDAMLAVSLVLVQAQLEQDYPLFQRLFTQAHADNRHALLFLFRDAAPERALPDGARLPEVRLPMENEITLGARRSMASGGDRRLLERLIHDPNPMVTAKLMKNPSIRRQDVVQVASRRPTTPELLEVVIKEMRWIRHHDVREALVRNPYVQTGFALKLLPTLQTHVLEQVVQSGELHHGVKSFAKLLLDIHSWQVRSPS